MNSELLSNVKCQELKKQAVMIMRRLREIQDSLLIQNSSLSASLSFIIVDLSSVVENSMASYRCVTEDHLLDSLVRIDSGLLCVEVFKRLKEIGNKTSLESIMRGLMPPDDKNEAIDRAVHDAAQNTQRFLKDLDFLTMLTKKSRIGRNIIKKHVGFNSLKENIDAFEEAKERVDKINEDQRMEMSKENKKK